MLAILATPSVPLKGAKAMQKKLFIKACKWLKKEKSIHRALVTCSTENLPAELLCQQWANWRMWNGAKTVLDKREVEEG